MLSRVHLKNSARKVEIANNTINRGKCNKKLFNKDGGLIRKMRLAVGLARGKTRRGFSSGQLKRCWSESRLEEFGICREPALRNWALFRSRIKSERVRCRRVRDDAVFYGSQIQAPNL